MNKIIIAFDNGVTGTLSVFVNDKVYFYKTPVKLVENYQKESKKINRVDIIGLIEIFNLINYIHNSYFFDVDIYIERPFTNRSKIYSNAIASGMRALEAIEIFIEMFLYIPRTNKVIKHYVDSKEWQSYYNIHGTSEKTKELSKLKGLELFPEHKELILKHKDADSLLMGNYFKLMKKQVING